jgi:Tfp pilus assembly protein PilE
MTNTDVRRNNIVYCAKCGTGLPEDAIVCYKCATATAGYAVPQKNRLKSPLLIVAVVIAALILVPILAVVLLFGVGSYGHQQMVRSGNETNAAQTLDKIRTFQAQYAARNKGNFAAFDELIRKVGLDERFYGERPVVNGYTFSMLVEPSSINKPVFYSISADPMVGNGSRHFYTDSTSDVIKSTDENRSAKIDDPAI